MRKYDIVCAGDVNVDLILSGVDRLPAFGEEVLARDCGMHLGGCTANVATFAARLGMRAGLRSRVGTDDFGDFLMDELQKVGVSTEFIIRDPDLRTGLTVSLSGAADRAFVTYLGTIDSLTREDVTDDVLASARHLHVGSYFLQSRLRPGLADVLCRARQLGVTTSLDTGYDPSEQWDEGIRDVVRQVDVFMPNDVEAPAIAGIEDPREAGRELASGAARVALKLGAEGSALFAEDSESFAPGFSVAVVDTTCCGDAFNAGFLCAMLSGKPDEEALRWGNAAGAIVAGGSGTSVQRLSREAIGEMVGE